MEVCVRLIVGELLLINLEGRFHNVAIIPAMLYGIECWALRNNSFTE